MGRGAHLYRRTSLQAGAQLERLAIDDQERTHGGDWPVARVWVALDPLPQVVEAACRANIDLLITHHPLIFKPLTAVDCGTPTGMTIQAALRNRMTIFAAHTNLDAADVSVTNLDDDVAGFEVAPLTGLITTEAGGSDTFSVVLTGEPLSNVTISVNSSDTTEGSPSPSSLVFTSSNWNSPQSVTVNGVDDNGLDDGDIAYLIQMVSSSGDPAYDNVDLPNVLVTNLDDDHTPVASPDTYYSDGVNTLTVGAPGVLGNDSDEDTGDTLTAVLDKDVENGTEEAYFT